jgi:chemotaxis protein histidine kinase CheA
LQQAVNLPLLAVSLFQVSGVVFALPEKQIIRSFPIKKWVSDSFIERGKVKLKNIEIPLFNIFQVFKLKPSTEENPLVILIKGREDHPAALIIDKAISREEIEYQSIEGRPYILGQGISGRGRVWILNVEEISP